MAQFEISERFKNYEEVSKTKLVPRMPVIIRLDGKSFSGLTRKIKAEKPFDKDFADAMIKTTIALCEDIHPVMAYTQSDEISLVLLNDRTLDTQAWFGLEVQKMVSVSAGIASAHLALALDRTDATFDSRVFNVPHNEVINYLICRQLDARRNACNIWSECALGEKVGRGTARKMLHGLSAVNRVALAEKETGASFDDIHLGYRYGWEIAKTTVYGDGTTEEDHRPHWLAMAAPIYADSVQRERVRQRFIDYYDPEDIPTHEFV